MNHEIEQVDRWLMEEGRGDLVLDRVATFLRRFVAYPSGHALVAHVLWIAHTHRMALWESTPRIAFLSPEPGSGKTRALEVTALLVPNPVEAVNVTPAYLFRKVAEDVTVLFDEIDTVFGPRAKENEEIRGLLNAGHRKGAVAGRCVVKGHKVETEEIPAYCAVALAGLDDLPDTIMTRSVVVRMRKRAPTERVEPFRERIHRTEGHNLREQLERWAKAAWDGDDSVIWPVLPEEIVDRNADVWEPLIAVAEAAGGQWPARAQAAAVALVAAGQQRETSLGVRLLSDLRTVFGEREHMSSADILAALIALDEAPWADLRGKPLDARGLAARLRRYGVSSKNIRRGDETVFKGYERGPLAEQWVRYLPPPNADEDRRPLPGPEECATAATDGRAVADVADSSGAGRACRRCGYRLDPKYVAMTGETIHPGCVDRKETAA